MEGASVLKDDEEGLFADVCRVMKDKKVSGSVAQLSWHQ
jgi:hypothetical protein